MNGWRVEKCHGAILAQVWPSWHFFVVLRFLGMAGMNDLPVVCWRCVVEHLNVNETAILGRVSFGRLSDIGGFEWVVEAHQDYWRLIDWLADCQYEEWLRRDDISSAIRGNWLRCWGGRAWTAESLHT